MMNWAKQQLANVAGTPEPIHGPSAIQSVAEQAKETPYTELTRDDLKWKVMESTNVETQTFYMLSDSGVIGMAQVIYSNVAGIRTTAQFNSKITYTDGKTPLLWSSDALDDYGFDQSKLNFHAKGCSVDLAEDGNSYVIKSTVNKKSVVDLKFTRVAPGFVAGNNGTSTYGTDPKKPWGSMRHAFWPRCKVEGSIVTKNGPVDFTGKGIFIHALQGMKPHHAAARWNFAGFHSPTYSAVLMEFITPPSYGSTTVSVGGIVTDKEIILANASTSAKHTEVKKDPENGWPAPSAARFTWTDNNGSEAVLEGPYGEKVDRVDIMAEVPGFVKQIVAGAAGTKPYIYQYAPEMTLHLKTKGEETQEKGRVFTEATFISAD